VRVLKALLLVLSLATCLIAAALWPRSYRIWDMAGVAFVESSAPPHSRRSVRYGIESVRGSIGIGRHESHSVYPWRQRSPDPPSVIDWYWSSGPVEQPRRQATVFAVFSETGASSWYGFSRINYAVHTGGTIIFSSAHGVAMPHSLLVLLTGAWPALRLRGWLMAGIARRAATTCAAALVLRRAPSVAPRWVPVRTGEADSSHSLRRSEGSVAVRVPRTCLLVLCIASCLAAAVLGIRSYSVWDHASIALVRVEDDLTMHRVGYHIEDAETGSDPRGRPGCRRCRGV
jgi:hypothetical protein